MMPEGFKVLDRKDVLSTSDFQKRIAMIIAKKDSADIFEVSLSPEAVEVIWEYGDMVTIATTSMGDFAIIPGIDRDAKNARDFDIGIENDDHFFPVGRYSGVRLSSTTSELQRQRWQVSDLRPLG